MRPENRERKSTRRFSDEVVLWTSARHVRAQMLVFLQDLESLTGVFAWMSTGTSGQKLPLCADSSFQEKTALLKAI